MDTISDPVVRITCVGRYRYHIVVKDGSRWIDEEIDRGEHARLVVSVQL